MSAADTEITFTCNGHEQRVKVQADRLLIDVLREDLGLTGTKLGCGTGDCGACTVLLDGELVTSCLIYAIECDAAEVETIEAVAKTPAGVAVAEAFLEYGAVQCGICTPGLVLASTALLTDRSDVPDDTEIKDGLAGNLCRCTGYYPIIRAVKSVAPTIVESSRGT